MLHWEIFGIPKTGKVNTPVTFGIIARRDKHRKRRNNGRDPFKVVVDVLDGNYSMFQWILWSKMIENICDIYTK